MAAGAFRAIGRHGGFATRDIVRIVARATGQPPTARTETGGLAQTVRLVDDLKPVSSGVRIEVDHIGTERLPRAKRKGAAIEAADHLRQLDAGGLEMTLHADIH